MRENKKGIENGNRTFSEDEESTMEKEILQDAVGLGVVITIIAAALVWGAFV
ncbi:MAG: hypothetical protein AAFW83_00365 [Pseudomonadota bacterium]